MKSSMTEELDLLDQLVQYHLKSYQVWCDIYFRTWKRQSTDVGPGLIRRQHRRTIILALNDPSRELDFTAKALAIDEKNYHTWAYRQWVLCHFWSTARSLSPEDAAALSPERRDEVDQVWRGELEYVDKLLESDIRNNSAWNHRFFVSFESGMGGDDAGEREIQCVAGGIVLSEA